LDVNNTILWNNTAGAGSEIALINYSPSNPSTLTISYSDVQGGQSSAFVESGCVLNRATGMIDADPLFSDPVNHDFHLPWDSPCRDTGDNAAVTELYDFEGDPRIVGTVDMGADEFYYHLYSVGAVQPGSPIDIKIVGLPGRPVLLALVSGIQDPPLPTAYGDLWLTLPVTNSWQLGPIPGTGILALTATVPSGWQSGSQHPFQALVGPWGGESTVLTNLLVLEVE